jgi:lambda family phage portal protein
MTLVGRLIKALAPSAAPVRDDGMAALLRKRRYDAAARGRLTEDWAATTASADVMIERDAALLRARMRDLVRNNSYAAKAVQVLVNNIVGTGIEPRAASPNKARNRRVDRLFAEWSVQCDVAGISTFHALVALAVREMIEGGDVFAVRRFGPVRSLRVPLQIELREADHLDVSKLEERDAYRIDAGIEYDREGRRIAYWLYDHHPGGRLLSLRGATLSRRLPVDQVVHLFERQRLQSRGVPWGTPAMRDIRDMGDWRRAELTRKKLEAAMVGIVTGDDEEQDSATGALVVDSEGNEVERWEPGMFAYLRGGKDITFNDPKPHGGIYEWTSVQAHDIASGFRIPYEYLTSDLKQVNFSSSRLGLNEFRRMVEQVQWQLVIPVLCQRLWDWFIDAAYLAGEIDVPDVPVKWQPPRFESVNPLQDVQADIAEVRAGFATTAQKIAARGYLPDEVIEEQAAYLAAADDAGLVVDTDPRRVAKSGALQSADPPDDAPGTPPATDPGQD